ncbi:Lysosomal alpha-mannosidase [Bulinus truncatus]|nr:Lysosomal alpha-mannosidase [Bulinus truncatus]
MPHLSLTFNTVSGLLVSMTNKDSSVTESVSQDFNYYEAQQDVHRFSGAYVFIPKHPATFRVAGEQKVKLKVVKGPLVQEVHQTFTPWVSQVVRLYKDARHVELQWTVGPIDDSDHQGKEVISMFTTTIVNTDTFYTDCNGREMMERVKDVRDTWNYIPKDHVSGNYYPVTSRIVIKDTQKNVQFTVLPDRPQGGSSLGSGVVELMVHRKLMNDDGLGVGEPLNDKGIDDKGVIYTGKHYLVLDTIENSAPLVKRLALQVHLAPTFMFTPANGDTISKNALKEIQFLTNELPDNVHVLTLDRIASNETSLFLLRLEHVFEEGEHPVLSLPAEVSLENLFKPFEIVSAVETTLGGNFIPGDLKRLQWKAFNDITPESISSPDYKRNMFPSFTIQLKPMEIRTFHVQIYRTLKMCLK